MPPASAHQWHIIATFHCLPVHINATYQCPSELPFSVIHQCQSVTPINASQCHLSLLPISATISARQCRLSVCISAHQCCLSASQCRLSMPPNSAIYECCLSVPISATYQCLLISATYQCPSVQPH
ncbi:unnamed protein product [Staurois parvus]|uniref:Uncharacterized protein n=1 Tax=Staurois parvus TaxID=386267 RepID=A0ABN9FCK9_9NEOB|nr:unnamed protein product [Staurois parvus]